MKKIYALMVLFFCCIGLSMAQETKNYLVGLKDGKTNKDWASQWDSTDKLLKIELNPRAGNMHFEKKGDSYTADFYAGATNGQQGETEYMISTKAPWRIAEVKLVGTAQQADVAVSSRQSQDESGFPISEVVFKPGHENKYIDSHIVESKYGIVLSSKTRAHIIGKLEVKLVKSQMKNVNIHLMWGNNSPFAEPEDLVEIKTIQNVPCVVGIIPEIPNNEKITGCNYAFDNPVTAETNDMNCTVMYMLDIPFCQSYEQIREQDWRFMRIRSTLYSYTSGNDVYTSTKVNDNDYDAYKWAFIGNPYSIQIVNKKSGKTKVLASKDPFNAPNTGGNIIMGMHDKTEQNLIHDFKIDGIQGNSCYIKTQKGVAVNDRGEHKNKKTQIGRLSYWQTSGALDDGSVFVCQNLEQYNAHMLQKEFDPYFAQRGKIGFLPTTLPTDLQADYNQGIKQVSEEKAKQIREQLYAQIIYPDNGFYRIKNKAYSQYIGKDNDSIKCNFADKGVETIIKFTKKDNNKYTIQIQGAYAQKATQSNLVPQNVNRQEVMSLWLMEPGVFAISKSDNKDRKGFYHASQNQGYALVGWEKGSLPSNWMIEPVTTFEVNLHPLAGKSYGTVYSPYAFAVSGNVKAYTASVSGNSLFIHEINGDVPAKTPVLLIADDEATIKAILTLKQDATTVLPENQLLGTMLKKEVVSGDYYLGNFEGKAGFYHWSGNNLGANKAYLPASVVTGDAVTQLPFADVVDAIQNIVIKSNDGIVYDLQGRRVNYMQKGHMYIKNGKKLIY